MGGALGIPSLCRRLEELPVDLTTTSRDLVDVLGGLPRFQLKLHLVKRWLRWGSLGGGGSMPPNCS